MTFDSSRDLEPLDYAGILDKSLDLYAKNAQFVLSVVGVVYVPVILLHIVGLVFFPDTVDMSVLLPRKEYSTYGQLLPLLEFVAIFVTNCAIIVALGHLLIGRPSTVRHVYRALAQRLPAIIGTSLLSALAVFVTMRVVWIMAYLLFIPLAFVAEAVVLEKRKYLDAMQRSVFMTCMGGEGLRVLIISVATGLVWVLANWIVGYVLSWLPDGSVMSVLKKTTLDLLNLSLTPFSFFAMTLLYIDIRVRYDQYDTRALENELPE